MTTVELSNEALDRLKCAKNLIQKRFNIKMRMQDIMDHLVTNPDEIAERIFQSIHEKMGRN